VESLVGELSRIHGIRAVVLGGSFARGRARPDSDIDLGMLYDENAPFNIDALRDLAARVNEHGQPSSPTSTSGAAG
jgi:predicted nucleotidyltransferase